MKYSSRNWLVSTAHCTNSVSLYAYYTIACNALRTGGGLAPVSLD